MRTMPPGVSLLEIMDAATDDRGAGFCLACREERDGFTEPDACNYPCEKCGKDRIYGAELLILMNMS